MARPLFYAHPRSRLALLMIVSVLALPAGCSPEDEEGTASKAAAPASPSTLVAPDAVAELFGEDVINTDDGDEYGPALSPDGRLLLYTKRLERDRLEHIVFARWEDDAWTPPTLAPFSGMHFDKEPYFSPDGTRLFFASKRPVDGTDLDFEIWSVARTADGWGDAAPVAAVNSAAYDNYPAVSAAGTLYFSSKREGSIGGNDLYHARWDGVAYQTPEPLTALNTPDSDADPYIDPQERFLIFSSTRPGGYGSGDLYISYQRDGQWSAPENLGPAVNTDGYEYTPLVSPDGQHLYFSRDWGEMYRIALDAGALAL